ncbi:hypothetical protein [Bartonella sp. AU18XJBT]|uniref:hypothetical protein n=1 Tax=Bartonella sp. AU18XJBT TaxID=3019089 RepID=UPI0023629EB0|nr:hypothetical protein [Bartonella sp. AU18XJBT]
MTVQALCFILIRLTGGGGLLWKGFFLARGLPDDVCFVCAIKGKVLSLNDVSQIRKIFSQFKIKGVGASYTSDSKNPTPAQELIISN